MASPMSWTKNSSRHSSGVAAKRARHRLQRVALALELGQLGVHPAHEAVEVQAQGQVRRHALVQQVEQQGLAAADAAPQVQAARTALAAQRGEHALAQGVDLGLDRLRADAVQFGQHRLLRGVGLPAARRDARRVGGGGREARGACSGRHRLSGPAAGCP